MLCWQTFFIAPASSHLSLTCTKDLQVCWASSTVPVFLSLSLKLKSLGKTLSLPLQYSKWAGEIGLVRMSTSCSFEGMYLIWIWLLSTISSMKWTSTSICLDLSYKIRFRARETTLIITTNCRCAFRFQFEFFHQRIGPSNFCYCLAKERYSLSVLDSAISVCYWNQSFYRFYAIISCKYYLLIKENVFIA